MAELSEWLNIMLGEIARKQDDAVRALREQELRAEPHGSETPAAAAATPATETR
jgi:hypothetical protein